MNIEEKKALQRDFDLNVEKADQEGAFWTRIFAMLVNVFFRRYMGIRHFDIAIFMATGIILFVVWNISSLFIFDIIDDKRVQIADVPMFFYLMLWLGFAIYRLVETRRLIREGFKLHSKYRGLPWTIWQKLTPKKLLWITASRLEVLLIALLGFLFSFFNTHIDLLLYVVAVGKWLFETIDVFARQEADRDELDARLAMNKEYSEHEEEATPTEYDGKRPKATATTTSGNTRAARAERKSQSKKNAFNLDGADFDMSKHTSAKPTSGKHTRKDD